MRCLSQRPICRAYRATMPAQPTNSIHLRLPASRSLTLDASSAEVDSIAKTRSASDAVRMTFATVVAMDTMWTVWVIRTPHMFVQREPTVLYVDVLLIRKRATGDSSLRVPFVRVQSWGSGPMSACVTSLSPGH